MPKFVQFLSREAWMNEYDFGSRHRAQKRKVHWNSENKIRYLLSAEERLLQSISARASLPKLLNKMQPISPVWLQSRSNVTTTRPMTPVVAFLGIGQRLAWCSPARGDLFTLRLPHF
jgi:hypothetical protein